MIIGLCGPARSGKTTVANILEEDYGFEVTSFAEPLRRMALAINPLIMTNDGRGLQPRRLACLVKELGWDKAKDDYREIRRILQTLGTEAGRDVLGQDVWIDYWRNNLPEWVDVVVADCRFPNEAAAIRAEGGYVIKIVRPGVDSERFANQNHPSESALSGIRADYLIVNDGDGVDSLAGTVRTALASFAILDREAA